MKKEHAYNEEVMGDEGFIAGDAYPSLDGESADNLTDVPGADLDTLAGDDEEEGEDDEESEKPSAGDECAELRDKNLRLQAEFDNFRTRRNRGGSVAGFTPAFHRARRREAVVEDFLLARRHPLRQGDSRSFPSVPPLIYRHVFLRSAENHSPTSGGR